MYCICFMLVSYFGLQGVEAIYSDGYIGCYKMQPYWLNPSTHCCCIMGSLPEEKVPDDDCSHDCPNRTVPGETCGGPGTYTIYDAQKTTTTRTTRTITTSTTTSTSRTTTLSPTTSTSRTTTLSPTTSTSRTTTLSPTTSTSRTTKLSTTTLTSITPSVTSTINNTSETVNTEIMCLLICVAATVGLVIINNVGLCVYKKIRRSKTGTKTHVDGYGYISPVNVVDLSDTTPDDNVLTVRNVDTTNIAGTSANMYDYVGQNITTESQYIDMV